MSHVGKRIPGVVFQRAEFRNSFFDGCETVLLAKVAVNEHGKCAAGFVAESAADRWNIDTGFDAGGSEEMPKIMVRELRIA